MYVCWVPNLKPYIYNLTLEVYPDSYVLDTVIHTSVHTLLVAVLEQTLKHVTGCTALHCTWPLTLVTSHYCCCY
jgi:hypothetical protein